MRSKAPVMASKPMAKTTASNSYSAAVVRRPVGVIVSSGASYLINGAIAKARYANANKMNFEAPLTFLVWLTSIVSVILTYIVSYYTIPTLGDGTLWWKLSTVITCGTLAGATLADVTVLQLTTGGTLAGITVGPNATIDGTALSAAIFEVIRPPRVTSFAPAGAPVDGVVTINGTNLTGTAAVTFGGTVTAVAQPGSSVIQIENAKPGSTDWRLTKVARHDDEIYERGWRRRRGQSCATPRLPAPDSRRRAP